jgi:transposase
MPNPYPSELRERAVRAYEAGEGSYEAVADDFSVSISSLLRWVMRTRTTGEVAAFPKRGGWHSPVQVAVLHAVIAERADATCEEIRRAYNRRVGRGARVSRSSIVRAVRRTGYVLKKNARGRARSTGPMSGRNGPRS